METLLESIKAAVSPDATDDVRAAGATACRTILTALDARAGEPLAPPGIPSSSAITAAITALRNVPPEQLLDLAITRLRAALPPDTKVPVTPLKFHVVSLPKVLGKPR